jgi:hypothetical protein
MFAPKVRKAAYLLAAACLASVSLWAFSAAQATGDSAKISKLLQDAKVSAVELKHDADVMERYTRSKVSWQSHAQQISLIREHINKVGKVLARMNEARPGASRWQQESIDRIGPMLKELASNTDSIIEHLNKNPQHLSDPNYTEYLTSNADLAADLSALIVDSVDYGNTKEKFEGLQQKLEVSGF